MKKWLWVMSVILVLTGCGKAESQMDRALALRSRLSEGCSFEAAVTADYGNESFEFTMSCKDDREFRFEVLAPETIGGITGKISEQGGALTFDDTALAFDLMADGRLSPVSAPWVVLRTLKSGFFRACGRDGNLLRIDGEDSFRENALQVSVWLDDEDRPVLGEILWQGRRILTVEVKNFQL